MFVALRMTEERVEAKVHVLPIQVLVDQLVLLAVVIVARLC